MSVFGAVDDKSLIYAKYILIQLLRGYDVANDLTNNMIVEKDWYKKNLDFLLEEYGCKFKGMNKGLVSEICLRYLYVHGFVDCVYLLRDFGECVYDSSVDVWCFRVGWDYDYGWSEDNVLRVSDGLFGYCSGVVVDFDVLGRIVGVEVLDASECFGEDFETLLSLMGGSVGVRVEYGVEVIVLTITIGCVCREFRVWNLGRVCVGECWVFDC